MRARTVVLYDGTRVRLRTGRPRRVLTASALVTTLAVIRWTALGLLVALSGFGVQL